MAISDLQEALDLIEGGRAEEAILPLRAWTQRMPAHAAAHAVLARAYEAVEQWEEAQAAWQRAHFLMPNSPAVLKGLERVHAATAELVMAGEDRLVMDLDLQAELEATLEALFNPFTLPQQSEVTLEEEPLSEEEVALAQVEAALAAAAEESDATEEIHATEAEATLPEAALVETATEDASSPGVKSIYEEIEQLIEEKEIRKETGAEALEDGPTEDVAEQEQAEHQDLEEVGEEEQEAVEALETMAEEETDEDDVEVEGWDEFEVESEEAAPSHDATIKDLDRLISELESARIVPQPDLEDIPPPELDDEIDDVVSETLARIYASQKKYGEAARVYEQLAHQHPKEAPKFLQFADEMRGLTGDANDQESSQQTD